MMRTMQGGILFLTNNVNTYSLYEWISSEKPTRLMSDRLWIGDLERLKPDLIVSYNYNYLVHQDCIEYMNGRILNLHISLLPWNRGFSPNIWSFIDDTPKGVTIHQMSAGLDEGDILFQRELHFEPCKETFESTYKKLNDAIVSLFQTHWAEIRDGTCWDSAHKQTGTGSYHTIADLKALRNRIDFEWSDNIAEFLERYSTLPLK